MKASIFNKKFIIYKFVDCAVSVRGTVFLQSETQQKETVCTKYVHAGQAVRGKTTVSFWFRKLGTGCSKTYFNSL